MVPDFGFCTGGITNGDVMITVGDDKAFLHSHHTTSVGWLKSPVRQVRQ
ncbi:hypothetical protein AC01_2474 [Escherichia coli 1-392-07_S3_C1]|nr:hypothetical protein AC57_4751 [Escherichia coli 1-392-07_S3_C3]KDW57621.1 hypothetical protein AC29_2856 [Escherichia coli 1-392-07_S3_C2]KDX03320.1 hypothetical protein AC01_2474 [Escherichia coli 1-392-07_S3_C1]KDZ73294.1 hypothetical protein AD14_3766 [Escherichia coli 3-073-06_S4_C2]